MSPPHKSLLRGGAPTGDDSSEVGRSERLEALVFLLFHLGGVEVVASTPTRWLGLSPRRKDNLNYPLTSTF